MKIGDNIMFKTHYYDMGGLGGIIPQFLDKVLPFLLSIFYRHRILIRKGEKRKIKNIYFEREHDISLDNAPPKLKDDVSVWIEYGNGGTIAFNNKLTKKYFFLNIKQERKAKLNKLWCK